MHLEQHAFRVHVGSGCRDSVSGCLVNVCMGCLPPNESTSPRVLGTKYYAAEVGYSSV